MGFISRKIFPACGNMCVCCPALRSRSRQPVKRYKKLLAEIFPKSIDGPPNERKIVKLCEYAVKNPLRIPKIVKYLEERCLKELRVEHIQPINTVSVAYNKLLCICEGQMAYFAVSMLNVINELLNNPKLDSVCMLGCQNLTTFIYSQTDGTYTHNIEKLVRKVCALARERGEEHQRRCLRAASLQCLSAMVWFMGQFSHIFVDVDEIIHATLDNYKVGNEDSDGEQEPHHNWVDEVVRCEGRGIAGKDASESGLIIPTRLERKDSSCLTREEMETPEVWAQICVQRMVELAKESTTLRRILEPVFVYFDSGRHWVPQNGLVLMVLFNMCYLMESSGNQQLILASVIRHLDHKNIVHDLQLKTCVIQVATSLARQLRSGRVLGEIGFVCDLCRHLKKSLQATMEAVGEEELNINTLLQNSIEDCLLEIAKGIGDIRPLFDIVAITLENLPSGAVAKATIGSVMILARAISLALFSSQSKQVFPETLLVQLLRVMVNPDIESRVGAHQIFSVLLIPGHGHQQHEVSSLHAGSPHQHKRWNSHTSSTSASIAALLVKLQKGKDGTNMEKHGNNVNDECRDRDNIMGENWKQGWAPKNSPNLYPISSIIDRTAGSTSLPATELCVMKLTEDQVAQLLSSFWIQANLPDNLPSNIAAIARSFILTLISLGLKSPNDSLLIRIFQLPLSLWNTSLDPNSDMLAPVCQRSIFVLAAGMLLFACKFFHISDLNSMFKSLAPNEVDPYLGISDDHEVYVKSHVDNREYGTVGDYQIAMSILCDLRNKISEFDKSIKDVVAETLASITELEAHDITMQLSDSFTPDETFLFGPQLILDQNQMVSYCKESLSFDGDFTSNSLVEEDATSEASVSDTSRFIPRTASSPHSLSHVISIGQLVESALEVAGQVAGSSLSTSPLPYNTMASQCEALGTGARQKLSNWLAHENHQSQAAERPCTTFPDNRNSVLKTIKNGGEHEQLTTLPKDPWLAMRLPPASPFDNFLKAAGC